MCAQTYNPDSEYNISFNVFNEPIPLSINTIYYVENPGNDELNLLVQLFFKLDLNALLPNDLRRLQYRCCFLSHSKIQADYLYKRIVNRMDNDNPATAEAIDFLRACLHADTGGYLVARQMPKISQKDETIVFDKEEHVVSFPLLDAIDTLERARFFLLTVAKADFQSLSGISYDRYCNDKYERCYNDKYEWNSPKIGSNTLSVLVNKSDIQGIDDDFRRLLIALDKAGKIKLSPKERKENTSDIIEKIVGKIRDYHKIDKFCKLTVDNRGNIFYSQGSKQIKCRFERYRLSRVIYILFLRQIERAAADTSGKTPKSICVTYLNEYEDELFAIYEAMEPSGNKKSHSGSIKVLCEDSSNERSKINTFFNDTFNLDEIEKNNNGKHYTIKIVNKDPKSGLSLYAVGLDIDDFDLGLFSIDKLRV